MKCLTSISIANSQMQLMNYVEAVHAYGCGKNWLINGNISSSRNKQIESFYEDYNLNKIFKHYINLRLINCDGKFANRINLIYSRIAIALILFFVKMDYAFFGNYLNPVHRYLVRCANIKNNKCNSVLVDDGTGTMLFAKERQIEQTKIEDRCIIPDRATKFLFSSTNSSVLSPEKLEFFTIYPIQGLLGNDTIKKNNYDIIKRWGKKTDLKICSNALIIVGQTLVEEKLLSFNKYQELLSDAFVVARENYGVRKVIYCPHPGEKNVENKLNIFNDIIIHRNKAPFELFALSLPSSCIIAGFYSSSLWNISYLGVDAPIRFIPIAADDILCGEPFRSHIINVYKSYQDSSIIKRL